MDNCDELCRLIDPSFLRSLPTAEVNLYRTNLKYISNESWTLDRENAGYERYTKYVPVYSSTGTEIVEKVQDVISSYISSSFNGLIPRCVEGLYGGCKQSFISKANKYFKHRLVNISLGFVVYNDYYGYHFIKPKSVHPTLRTVIKCLDTTSLSKQLQGRNFRDEMNEWLWDPLKSPRQDVLRENHANYVRVACVKVSLVDQ